MRICDRCFHTGIGSTVAIKQITTSDELVIDLCSTCFQNFSEWLTGQKTAVTYSIPQEVQSGSERRRGRPPANAVKAD